jgi:protease I
MSDQLQGKRIAILVANEGVEEVELTSPRDALREAGADVDLLAPEGSEVQAFNHLDKADTFAPDKIVGEVDPDDYDGLVLPGGVGKPVGAICHGPWTLINADVVDGRTLTSWPSLQADLRNAGAEWVDEEVHVDQGLVSSRKPDDLEAFNAKLVEEFAEGVHEGQRESASAGA